MVIVLEVNIYSVQNGSNILMWYKCNCDKYTTHMRYTYLIKDQQGKEEEYKAMSYRKLLKKLSSKYSNKIVQINYRNKKDHHLVKIVKIKEVE